MSERDYLLAALIKEVLGPRGGPREILLHNQEPRNEYITGVLAPRDAQERPDIEADADLPEEEGETAGEEDLEDPGIAAVPAVSFSPALNPKALPHSIGLSFIVEGQGSPPAIEVCATWARYCHPPSSSDWQREPGSFLTGVMPVAGDQLWPAGPGVALYLRTHPRGPSRYRISLYLVNTMQPHDPERIATEELLFQPQIRVHCAVGTSVVPLPGGLSAVQQAGREPLHEDESLALLYRERRPMARGHLCGATWKDIDPERPYPTLNPPADPPYIWTDATSVPGSEQSKFSPADVRTEFVPCYPVESPDMNWHVDEFPTAPLLDPDGLAELWDPGDVRTALEPLADSYAVWIAGQRQHAANLDPSLRSVAARHLQQCEEALQRIREGIQLIEISGCEFCNSFQPLVVSEVIRFSSAYHSASYEALA